MGIKKNNVVSLSLTHKNLMFLQKLGYINKRKKSTGKFNNSEFINRCMDRIIAIDWPELDDDIEEKLLLMKIQDLQEKRDKFLKLIEKDLREVAQALGKLRESKKAPEPQEPQRESEAVLQVLKVNAY